LLASELKKSETQQRTALNDSISQRNVATLARRAGCEACSRWLKGRAKTVSGMRITARVFRLDPSVDREPYYKEYEIPFEEGMSAMDVLDYIYQNLDGMLSYYDHAGCALGICGRCTGRVNGRAGLFCQVPVTGDVTLDPISPSRVLKDLVCEKKEQSENHNGLPLA